MTRTIPRSRLGAIATTAAVVTCATAALSLSTAGIAQAAPISVSGSMEGALQIHPGDWVAAGYHFRVQGAKSGGTYTFAQAEVRLPVSCSAGSKSVAGDITVPLATGPWTVRPGDGDLHPWSDQGAPAAYQGGVKAPDLCGGGPMYDDAASGGATFAADVHSTNTHDPIAVQFHYRVPAAKGKGNIDCADGIQHPADVCGASESPTVDLTPTPVTAPTTAPAPTSPAPTGTPSHGASAPPSPTSPSAPASSASPAPSGNLAHTGTSAMTWLAIGAVLLLVGLGSVSTTRLARNRRH
ncbi:hypothetical protein NGB36_14210 [Streptomyces sp. RB6PN25]|uniref:Gram-positive cocci surface proteins LPxTG domain-containing protein n=1 Tax=Streptomyces humicola TaxID=2953240 RepID=A0ABT1PVN3_9ACTN|nr:hypothetical protein [Streptomyces humicola]MCQ4081731.1 hypothetical protein [Streptomyces humicola]